MSPDPHWQALQTLKVMLHLVLLRIENVSWLTLGVWLQPLSDRQYWCIVLIGTRNSVSATLPEAIGQHQTQEAYRGFRFN